MRLLLLCLAGVLSVSCKVENNTNTDNSESNATTVNSGTNSGSASSAKLTSDNCTDPDLSKLAKGESFMLCDGTIGEGTFELAPADVRSGVEYLGQTGTFAGASPDAWDLRYGVTVGETTGKLKVNCRNMAELSRWDLNTDGLNELDTIEVASGGVTNISSQNPWSGDQYHCGYNNPTDPTWERVTTTPATSGSNSVFLDH